MEYDKYDIKSVRRSLKILDLLGSSERMLTINDVCGALDINTNMAFRLLATLVSSGFVIKDRETGNYGISLKVLQLSRNALLSMELRKFSRPYLELLWNQFQKANVNMAVYHSGEILVIDRIEGLSIPRIDFTPGQKFPFHCTAVGKILTSELPEEELDKLIAQKGLKAFTANTITDVKMLKKELAQVRTERLARDRQEHILKDNCNAVPIYNSEGKIVAAISIAAFEHYMPVEELESAVLALHTAANKISSLVGFHDEKYGGF